MASITLGIVGSYYGGPIGGAIGASIGAQIDQALFGPETPDVEGPRIPDVNAQAHAPGQAITIPYGNRCPTAGALVWTSNLIETKHTEDVEGGKGVPGTGSDAEVITYTYSVNVALLVCEGPIVAVTKIWANNKLFYNNGSFGARALGVRVALGTQTQQPDSMLETAEGVGNVPAFRGRAMVYIEGLELADFGNTTPQFKFEVQRASTQDTVRYIITDQCERVGMTDGVDFDTTCIPLWSVAGLPVANIVTPRAVITALQKAFDFDATDSGGKLLFRDRNRMSDLVINEQDFATVEPEDDLVPAEPVTRADDLELPKSITLKFLDAARDFDLNSVQSQKIVGGSSTDRVFSVPLVITPSEAKKAIDTLLGQIWLERRTTFIRLPHKYVTLDAGDIVRIRRTDRTLSEEFRIRRLALQQNGVVELELHPHIFRWALGSAPGDSAAGATITQVIPVVSSTIMQLFDIPLLTDSAIDTNSFYAAGYDSGGGNKWTGWGLYRALDGVTFSRLAPFSAGVPVGSTVTSTAAGPTDYPDTKNTIRVNFASTGTPTTVTNADLQRASNAAIFGAPGRWEVMQFRDANLVSGTTYDLSYLIRGRAGTEHNVGNHAIGDDLFVLSASNTKQIEQELNLLNAPIQYKGVTFFQSVASVTAESFTNTGQVKKPWAGVSGTAIKASGDWSVAWTRRNRQFGGWNNGGDVPMTEASEHYEGDVLDATASVVRTITVSTPAITYTSAQQVTDFGSTQASVTVNVYQMSQSHGRGNVHQITGQT